jgi:hypothetical protein
VASGSDIAKREGLYPSSVNELLHLTLLEPAIVKPILTGAAAPLYEPAMVPAELTSNRLGDTAGGDCEV